MSQTQLGETSSLPASASTISLISELDFDDVLRLGQNIQRIAHCCRDQSMTDLSTFLASRFSSNTTAEDAASILQCTPHDVTRVFRSLPVHDTVVFLEDKLRNASTATLIPIIYPVLRIVLLVATVTVIMRFISRLTVRVGIASRMKRITTEDWLILLALIFNHAFGIGGLAGTELYGIAKHTYTVSYNEYLGGLKLVYFLSLLYFPALFFIKSALLHFYCKLTPSRIFYYIAMATGIFILMFTVAFDLLLALQCYPQQPWQDLPDEKCLDKSAVFNSHAILNITTDFFILLMPIPLVMKLKLPFRSKISVIAIFGLGAIACIFSILRATTLNRLFSSPDPMWFYGLTGSYTLLETSIAISCASLPMSKPFILRYAPRLATAVFKSVRTSTDTVGSKRSNYGIFRLSRWSREMKPHKDSHSSSRSTNSGNGLRIPLPRSGISPIPSPIASPVARVPGMDHDHDHEYFSAPVVSPPLSGGVLLSPTDVFSSKRNSKRISWLDDPSPPPLPVGLQHNARTRDLEAGMPGCASEVKM